MDEDWNYADEQLAKARLNEKARMDEEWEELRRLEAEEVWVCVGVAGRGYQQSYSVSRAQNHRNHPVSKSAWQSKHRAVVTLTI